MTEWRKCSVCKKSINVGKLYQKCSNSSCHKSSFCGVECWDVHNGVMNHKSAGAVDAYAPMTIESADERAPRRVIVQPHGAKEEIETEAEILIVASKLKDYIKGKHDLSTSAAVLDRLSDIVRKITDEAASYAKVEGRKTLLERDFK